MTKFEVLNYEDHRRLRLRLQHENGPHFVQIIISEFAAAAASWPILLTKDSETGAFFPGIVCGLKAGECMLTDVSDQGGYQPLNALRDGFYISGERIIIDRANHRVSESEGEPLFDSSKQPTANLQQIQHVLGLLHAGADPTNKFVGALAALKLIEPIDISLRFDDGEKLNLQGLYTVSLDALRELDDAAVVRLFRSGDLQLAFAMIGSLKQIEILAYRRNRTLVAPLSGA